ncbi:hypothetical protein L1D54_23665, partial [Vibrio brasiliensis]|uniref:hypothetical protein n=1 Tax=Vibrio brasiliensis TaxID=170652 RepID=UPI001EFE10C8
FKYFQNTFKFVTQNKPWMHLKADLWRAKFKIAQINTLLRNTCVHFKCELNHCSLYFASNRIRGFDTFAQQIPSSNTPCLPSTE